MYTLTLTLNLNLNWGSAQYSTSEKLHSLDGFVENDKCHTCEILHFCFQIAGRDTCHSVL